MRILFAAALAVAAAGFADAPTASAAYECMGPGPSCAKSSGKAAYGKPTYRKTSNAASQKKYSQKSSKKSYSSVASGGGYSGMASYYWQPQRVASGGWFNPNAMTAAHKTLPFGTKVRVTNRNNGRSVVVVKVKGTPLGILEELLYPLGNAPCIDDGEDLILALLDILSRSGQTDRA